MNPLVALRQQPFVLAPMAGITDVAFRSFMREMGCPIVVTELISANGLEYSSHRTRDLMKFEAIQHPIGVQLFGESSEIIAKGAQYVESVGADFVDLNFGCPVPKVVKKGGGAAILRDTCRMGELLRTVRKSIRIPLTIKIRTGWDENSRNAVEVVRIAADEGIDWVAIHGRTRAQGYAGWADWDYIADVKAKASIPVLGNGDIQTAIEALERIVSTGVDGVLIGRGALKNPWIFEEACELWRRKQSGESTDGPVFQRNLSLALERLKDHILRHYDPVRALLHYKKFSAWFSTGFPGAAQFRKGIFQSQDLTSAAVLSRDFFGSLDLQMQASTKEEAFLMGGHG